MRLHGMVAAIGMLLGVHASAMGQADPAGPGIPERVFPSFEVWFEEDLFAEPVSGRLLVYFISDESGIGQGQQPVLGPFWQNPQPMFGLDVTDLKPGERLVIDDSNSLGCPVTMNDLPEGMYRVQALLDRKRENSSWREEDGHLMSSVYRVYVNGPDGIKDNANAPVMEYPQKLEFIRVYESVGADTAGGIFEYVSVPSALLSEFWGREVKVEVAVIPPLGLKSGRKYAAIYQIPGFGGNHKDGYRFARMRSRNPGFNALLNRSAYRFIIDPEGPNGHNLYADSANNGPVARAIIEEILPFLEAKYPLLARPEARLLEGHSSGAWSAIWLAMNHPETFGAAWASAPDPVDFRAFQLANIYEDGNMYLRDDEPVPAYRRDGEPIYSVALENGYEEVLGPANSSGQQWDSWQAVFGPRGENGHPAPLFDPRTGEIDHAVAESYRKYDIGDLLRNNPEKFGPIFKKSIRVRVGDMDSYYLNGGVALLKESLETLGYLGKAEEWGGYVEILPRLDHGSINDFDWKERMGEEMVTHLKNSGAMPQETAPVDPAETP